MPELKPTDDRSSSKPGQLSDVSPSTPLQIPFNSPHIYLYSPYSPDFLCKRLKAASASLASEPDLHGLVETEVFVGEEEKFLEDDRSYLEGVIPSTFVINYHKDTFPHPLNSVKEDVEAEEAEEEEISGNFHSLDYLGISMGPSSLSSSVISSASLDEGGLTSLERQNLNRYQTYGVCPNHPHGALPKLKSSHLSNSNGKLSPASYSRMIANPLKNNSPNSLVKDETPQNRSSCCKSFLQKINGTEKNKTLETRAPVWHNPSKADKLNTSKKESSSFLKRYGFNRAKSEAREPSTNSSNENKFSSLPRKKKEKNDKEIAAETYGTLGRNRKKKEDIQTPTSNISDRHARDIPQESKNILDKYATLPRRKAKELCARWREQQRENKDESHPKLQRSKSIGKETLRTVRASPSPSLSSASNSTVNSPRNVNSKQTSKLNLKIISPSARLLSRQNHGMGKEKAEKSPSPSIYPSSRQPRLMRNKKNVQVQVNLQWDLNENDLEEKLRKLEEEYASLQKRLRTAEANAEEVEQMRMEAVELRRQAENERLEKEELQEELDRTSGKVRAMLTSMEGVEKEFNNRGESLIELESQLQSSSDLNHKMQEKVDQCEDCNVKLNNDLDKSLAAQKILLHQVQDLEAEGREMVDFMAEEKNALSECLKEAELELYRQRNVIKELKSKLQQKDEETKHMLRLAEERRIEYLCLQTELQSLQSSAEDMMVCQGAQVSGASVGLANLSSRLQIITSKLIQDYSISENDIENVVTPVESDSSVSSANGTPDLPKSPIRCVNRSSSPRKPVSFMQSFLNAMRSAQNSSKLLLVKDKSNGGKLHDDRKSPEGGDMYSPKASTSSPNQHNLSDQVTDVDALLTRFLKVCCVLKSDADNILSELEDENERLCSQLQLQQQMIDQQYSEFESLSNLESSARKELKLITKDLEFANATLNKVCDDDTKMRVQNLDEALRAINLNLGRMETMHAEKKDKITQARNKMPFARSRHSTAESPKYRRKTFGPHHNRISVCKSYWKENKNQVDDDDFLNLNSSDENDGASEDKEHDLDYIVNHVLKTLETVPDIVSTCPALKNLYLHLSSNDPLGSDANCNPNAPSANHDQSVSNFEGRSCCNGSSSNGVLCGNREPALLNNKSYKSSPTLVPESCLLEQALVPESSPVKDSYSKQRNILTPSPVLPAAVNSKIDNHVNGDTCENRTNGHVDNQQNDFLDMSPNGNVSNSSISIDCNANPELADSNLQNGALHPQLNPIS